jgi:hypothetical protein
MGDYTWFKFTAAFKEGNQVLPTLSWLVDPHGEPKERNQLPEHAFFDDPYARFMLNKESAHHITGHSQLRYDDYYRNEYILTVDCSFKNHPAMLALFFSWLRPHDQGDQGFRGFYLPAYNEHPMMVYRELDRYVFRPVGLQRHMLHDSPNGSTVRTEII